MLPFRPRIFQPDAFQQGVVDDPKAVQSLKDAALLGLDHVLLRGDGDGSGDPATAARSLRAQGLGLFWGLSLDRPAAHSLLRQEHPGWQTAASDDDLPDPRLREGLEQLTALRLHDAALMPAILAWWSARLAQGARAGVAGYCLDLDGPAPPEFFARLIASVKGVVPECRFLAWTPGIPAARVDALASVGFDGAFSSSAWWDLRANWLHDEARRLRGYGAVIAMAGVPGRPGDADTAADPLTPARRQRSLLLAAATGDGLLVPGHWLAAGENTPGDKAALRGALALCARKTRGTAAETWTTLSAPGSPVAVLRTAFSLDEADETLVLVANATDRPVTLDLGGTLAQADGLALRHSCWPEGDAPEAGAPLALQGAQARLYTARPARPASVAPRDSRRAAQAAARAPRIAIEAITPCVDGGRFVSKRSVGDNLTVEADIFGEGHDRVAATLRWRAVDEDRWTETALQPLVNDRWQTMVALPRVGRYQYQIEAWLDVFGAYRDELEKKTAAGQDVALELREGALLLQAALARATQANRQQLGLGLKRALKALDEAGKKQGEDDRPHAVTVLLADDVAQLMAQADDRPFSVRSTPLQVDAERRAASFSSWYELFPRSMGAHASNHGTFLDVIPQLSRISAMGFDTLYFPPVHPIGLTHRKGRNNTLQAAADDPGSPYAIGAAEGGHDAIHPELGTLEDFRTLRDAAASHGLELALDFAIQCSPDHPWLKDRPDWFNWRPDGSIRYAENPPKKYQDIVNVDFYAAGAVPDLWLALRDVVLFWVKEGVKVFRVDNPHTKPLPFWEWMIADVRARYPEAIFLAEAFTRPKPMYRLAKAGFSQSYTYFTWRHGKREFIDYLTELTDGPPRDFFRPHFFVNTPDINPLFLQRSGRAGFVIRAALAATLSGLWGMYSGFELCEAEPVPGKEEYLNSEKYELRHRDWAQPGHIVREITQLNQIRRSNPALQSHLGVQFLASTDEDILCFLKTAAGTAAPANRVLVAICLDPHAAHDCSVELPLQDWGLPDGAAVPCEDLVHGNRFTLQGRYHTLRLDPHQLPFAIWRLHPEGDL